MKQQNLLFFGLFPDFNNWTHWQFMKLDVELCMFKVNQYVIIHYQLYSFFEENTIFDMRQWCKI